ncbi:MAG TPA: hypothetical protein DD727_07555, partial [Clostridiales bacterium]|nr:hypothetical protein [Clostridiales bacterium]
INGARGVLLHVVGDPSLELFATSRVAEVVHEAVDPDCVIILGVATDESMENEMMVTVIATGFDSGSVSAGRSAGLGSFTGRNAEDRDKPNRPVGENKRPPWDLFNKFEAEPSLVNSSVPVKKADAEPSGEENKASRGVFDDIDIPSYIRQQKKK